MLEVRTHVSFAILELIHQINLMNSAIEIDWITNWILNRFLENIFSMQNILNNLWHSINEKYCENPDPEI